MIIMIKNGVALRQITLPSATSPLHQPQCHQLHQLQSDHHHHHRGRGHHYHHQQQQQDDNLQDFQIKQHLKCHDHQPACHFCHFCLLLPFCHICRFCHFCRFFFSLFPFYHFCNFCHFSILPILPLFKKYLLSLQNMTLFSKYEIVFL